ncbi:hypothetical protein A5821_003318 [Enterococcus sp. 7F3_DIV0205]|uniref:Uncharacterized protein n=1 Tax=Candidatus Enterococcus palustris TaxID=1834189 RepID=A0AAQ3WBA7_9ENTE|nr:hypothetical protein A5821_000126 [Enterococcus sp. 7F3_DIV0205]
MNEMFSISILFYLFSERLAHVAKYFSTLLAYQFKIIMSIELL